MIATECSLGEIIRPAAVRRAGSGEYPILSMTMKRGLVDQADKFKKRIASADTSPYKVVRRGQLVVGFPIDEGVLSFQKLHDEAIVSPAYDVWDLLDPEAVSRQYLERYLRSPRALSYYAGKLQGSTARRRSLPRPVFLALPVVLPDLATQHGVVAVLDQVDHLRAKRREAVTLLDELAQSIFLDMFGEPILNPHGYEVRPLIDWVDGERPITYGILQPGDDIESGERYVRVADMRDGGINESGLRRTSPEISKQYSRSKLNGGDLIISIRGHVGRLAKVPDDLAGANITQDTARIAVPIESACYVLACLRSLSVQRWMSNFTKGAAVKGINLTDVKKIPIPVAPMSGQLELARRVESLSATGKVQRAALAALDELFESLQQRAFSGRLWDHEAA